MEIQQHDGVVVDAAVIAAGLRRASARGRGVTGGREAPGLRVLLPLLPSTIYRGPGGRRPLEIPSQGGAAAKGGLAPQVRWGAPTPRVSNPRRRGRPMGGAPAHQGLVPLPLKPIGPSGIGGPTRWTPGTLPVVPVQYR